MASGQTLVPLADLFNHAASGLHGARLIHDTEVRIVTLLMTVHPRCR